MSAQHRTHTRCRPQREGSSTHTLYRAQGGLNNTSTQPTCHTSQAESNNTLRSQFKAKMNAWGEGLSPEQVAEVGYGMVEAPRTAGRVPSCAVCTAYT